MSPFKAGAKASGEKSEGIPMKFRESAETFRKFTEVLDAVRQLQIFVVGESCQFRMKITFARNFDFYVTPGFMREP